MTPEIVAGGTVTNNPLFATTPEIVAMGTVTKRPLLTIVPEMDAMGTDTNTPELITPDVTLPDARNVPPLARNDCPETRVVWNPDSEPDASLRKPLLSINGRPDARK